MHSSGRTIKRCGKRRVENFFLPNDLTHVSTPRQNWCLPKRKIWRASSPQIIWRRERDSNPRYPLRYSGFQDVPLPSVLNQSLTSVSKAPNRAYMLSFGIYCAPFCAPEAGKLRATTRPSQSGIQLFVHRTPPRILASPEPTVKQFKLYGPTYRPAKAALAHWPERCSATGSSRQILRTAKGNHANIRSLQNTPVSGNPHLGIGLCRRTLPQECPLSAALSLAFHEA